MLKQWYALYVLIYSYSDLDYMKENTDHTLAI